MDNFGWILIGMASITFTCRYLFFANTLPFELGPRLKRALSFTAPAVLTAMWAPIVFLGHQTTGSNLFYSPFLYAGLLTLLLSLKINNTLAVVVIGMSFFTLLKFVL